MKTIAPMLFASVLIATLAAVAARAQAAETEHRQVMRKSDRGVSSDRIEEVVVTAQKREERLQDVPISISVLGGDAIDESTAQGITEMLNRVPGVATTVGVQGGQTQLGIRGVTASSPLFSGSSPIAFYLDSVPFGLVISAVGPDLNPYDLDRVEVLRGPQGTLYGANALNGVVRVLTRNANLDEFELKARVSGSSTEGGGENYRGDIAMSVPIITGKLAARAVVGDQHWSGWVDSPVKENINEGVVRNYRLKVDARPLDNFTIGLSGWRSTDHQDAPSTSDDTGRVMATVVKQPIENDFAAYGLHAEYISRAFTFSSRSSYLEYENEGSLWVAASLPYFFTQIHSRIYSEEAILSSNIEGPWRWSAGVFYRDGRDHAVQTYTSAITDQSQTSRSAAIFGEVSRRFLDDTLSWTLGLRYFHDKVGQIDGKRSIGEDSFNATTPRAVLTWYPTRELSLYASYSQGFRSGFPQGALVVAAAPDFPSVEPDTLNNYEIGAKGTLLEGRVAFDTAIYYIDWRDIQQTLFIPIGNGLFAFAPINTNSGNGVGVDMAVSSRPVAGLEVGISASWNDLDLSGDLFSMNQILFAKGQRLNGSPEWTAGTSVDYETPLGSRGFIGRFSASGNYTTKLGSAVIGAPPVFADAMLLTRASVSVEFTSGWTLTLFGENLNNEDGSTIKQYGNPQWDGRVRPRTIGLQIEVQL